MSIRRLFAEPLVQFALLGALLFAGHRACGPRPEDTIVIDAGAVEASVRALEKRGHSVSAEDRRAIVRELGDQEILIREATALGLHRGDPIIRRRLAQKMRFVLEDQVAPPTEDELRAWVDAHADRYRRPPRWSFEQMFFSGPSGQDRAELADMRLRAGESIDDSDAFAYGRRQDALTQRAIESRFGPEFATALARLPVGSWTTLQSSAGWHLVRVEDVAVGEMPQLDEVRTQAEADWRHAHQELAIDAAMDALRERYQVQVQEAAP